MNKNQAKGVAKSTAGKVQKTGGKLVGSRKHQVKGTIKEAEGKAQKGIGDLQETIRSERKNKKQGRR
jgi:uncharacterized protein YjbJ (UPF0337 family)